MQDIVTDLSLQDSVFSQFMAEMRDQTIHVDKLRFRRNLERAGEILAYEISKELEYKDQQVTTPLASASCRVLKQQPVLATVLRAGLLLHQGLLNYFDQSDNTFISAYRLPHEDNEEIKVEVEYLASPSVDGKTVILCDPMLATGTSLVLAYKALLARGTPSKIHVATVIASRQGVEYVRDNLPKGTRIWCGAIDEEMSTRAYIVPGLGDAGDLAYGGKL